MIIIKITIEVCKKCVLVAVFVLLTPVQDKAGMNILYFFVWFFDSDNAISKKTASECSVSFSLTSCQVD